MKVFSWILLLLLLSCTLNAQLVTKIDCCAEVGNKALIIINDNNTASTPVNPSPSNTATVSNNFNFTLSASANTSAGVYNSTSVLVRTLWSGVRYDAGCYTGQWDNLLDDGTPAPLGNYTVKVLTNNVQYTWEGVIGNTSASLFQNVYRSYGGNTGLAFAAGKGFFGQGFYEGGTNSRYFNLNGIQACLDVEGAGHGINIDNCTDGVNVYWLVNDQYQNSHFIYATKASDNSPVSFTNETSHPIGRSNETSSTHLIGYRAENNNNQYTGISVNDKFGFVTRKDNNTLNVFDKVTGSFVQTLPFNAPGRLAAGKNNELWIISQNPTYQTSVNAYVPANRITGTAFSSTPYQSNVTSNTQDGNFTTTFGSADGHNGYVGIDMGTAKTITQVAIAPENGSAGRVSGMIIQGSNVSPTAGFVNLYTITDVPPENQYTVYSFPNTTAYRYIRITQPNDFCSMAEFAVIEPLAASTSPVLNLIKKYNINTDGTLTDASITLNTVNPLAVTISPDNSVVLVADGGTSQQLKAFSNSTGAALWTLGQPGGYEQNGPAVTFDKFMFEKAEYAGVAVAYQPDGSFWVNDIGNYRMVHFNTDRTYKEHMAYMPSSRSTNADPNNPAKIFGDELEFQRDYGKPLDNGSNGSWVLKNNWKIGTILDGFRRFTQVVTLSNGHTYATGDGTVYDLRTTGAVFLGTVYGLIEADGSLINRNMINNNTQAQVTKQTLTGFGPDFMPQWGNAVVIATTPVLAGTDPANYYNNTRGNSTNTGKYFFFNQNTGPGYHLGAINKATTNTSWLWKASKSTFPTYSGDYPRNGDFDIGNNNGFVPQHSENCQALVQGTDIFWNVNAEAWKDGGEVNIWNHFNEDGLFIGNFGKTYQDLDIYGNNAGYAGNAYSTAIVKVGNGYYIYHCDESQHGGVHSWHVTGLNTISEVGIPISITAPVTVAADPGNLMAGIPYKSGFYGGSGWTVSPNAGIYPDAQYPAWKVATTVKAYQPQDNDIYVYVDGAGGTPDNTHYVSRTLGTNNTNNWVLTGQVLCDNATGNVVFEVLDAAGKILDQFRLNYSVFNNNINTGVSDPNVYTKTLFSNFLPFTLKNINGTVVFQFYKYPAVVVSTPLEAGGNFKTPATFRVRPYGSGGYKGIASVKGLRFVK